MKKTVAIGLFIVGLAGIFPMLNPFYVPLLISRFILGAGIGLFNPLAVSYISFLFDQKEVPTLMGFRSAVESIGQSVFVFTAGLLFNFGWHMSFAIYGFAFVILLIFWLKVPDVSLGDKQQGAENIEQGNDKMSLLVFPIVMFGVVILICAVAIGVRFPSLAAEIRGEGYNSSTIMSIQPIFNIFAALVFGKLHRVLGRKLLYVGLFSLVIALLLIGFSNGNYVMVVAALFIHGLVPAWVFPFIFNTIARITSGRKQNLAISFVMIGFNAGVFAFPFIIGFMERMIGSTSLTEVYPILAIVVATVLVAIMLLGNRISKISEQAISLSESLPIN
jgi:MFS family permease